jgi:hypothetical protein
MRLTRSVRVAIGGVLVTLVAVTALAQGRRFGRFFGESPASGFIQPNPPYDGRFVFLRVNYETAPGGFWYGGLPAWSHGYPLAEQNLMRILNEVTYIDPHLDGIATVGLDSPELFKYPMAYIIEVGWWVLSDGEAASLRAYLQKGGFILVDDFKMRGWGGGMGGGGWEQFEANMKRVMPEGRFLDLTAAHPIFHSFFNIGSFDIAPHSPFRERGRIRSTFQLWKNSWATVSSSPSRFWAIELDEVITVLLRCSMPSPVAYDR